MENKTLRQLIEESIDSTEQSIINGEHNLAVNKVILAHEQEELTKCPKTSKNSSH